MLRHHPGVVPAEGYGCVDVGEPPEPEELPSYQSRDARPARYPYHYHYVIDARVPECEYREYQEEDGERHHDFEQTGDDEVRFTAVIPGDAAQYDADDRGYADGYEADGKRYAGAVYHPRKNVPPPVVRPEKVIA